MPHTGPHSSADLKNCPRYIIHTQNSRISRIIFKIQGLFQGSFEIAIEIQGVFKDFKDLSEIQGFQGFFQGCGHPVYAVECQ